MSAQPAHPRPTGLEPPLWLRCEACAALEELVLGDGPGGTILCRRCTARRRTGPEVLTRANGCVEPALVQLEMERQLRRALDHTGASVKSAVIMLDTRPGGPGPARCRIQAQLPDETTLGVDCAAAGVDGAILRATERLCTLVARHESRNQTLQLGAAH